MACGAAADDRQAAGRIVPVVSWQHEVELIYTIHYVDPRCPAFAGLTLAFDAAQIAVLRARLKHDGYVITDVAPKAPLPRGSM
jgi:hypothetical protein